MGQVRSISIVVLTEVGYGHLLGQLVVSCKVALLRQVGGIEDDKEAGTARLDSANLQRSY